MDDTRPLLTMCAEYDCDYAHGEEDLVKRDECNNPKYKTALCTGWLSGYCAYGDKCLFLHGHDDPLSALVAAPATATVHADMNVVATKAPVWDRWALPADRARDMLQAAVYPVYPLPSFVPTAVLQETLTVADVLAMARGL